MVKVPSQLITTPMTPDPSVAWLVNAVHSNAMLAPSNVSLVLSML